MIKVALFTGNRDQADQYIHDNRLKSSEVVYVRGEEDTVELTDPNIQIVMHGTYHEIGEWYTRLADMLEERLKYGDKGSTSSRQTVPGFADRGAEEIADSGKPSEADISTASKNGRSEQSNISGNESKPVERPDLPRRKSNEIKKEN